MTINVGFLICSPIIQHILPIINLFSKNDIFNIVIYIENYYKEFENYDYKKYYTNIFNTRIITKNEFEKLTNYYIFISSPYSEHMSILQEPLFLNNKVLNVNYGYHIHKQLYYTTYNYNFFSLFYATFHECQENYDDYIVHMKNINCNFNVKTAHISGSTKIDYLNMNEQKYHKINNNTNILFSFRWENITKNNTQDTFNDYIINLTNTEQIELVFRPHPLDKNNSIRSIKRDNFFIDLDLDYSKSFYISDILISDLSTLICDYFIYTKKPVILMKNKNNNLNSILNSLGIKLIPGLYIVETITELDKVLNDLLKNIDPKKEIRENIANELNIYNPTKYIENFIINDYNTNYWNKFYKNNNEISELKQSAFCEFVIEYLEKNNLLNKHKSIIDLGCGNGRDLKFFNKYLETYGIDNSEEIISKLKNEGYNVFNDNLSLHNFKKYDFFYSRFSMHALHITDIVTLIKNLKLSYNKNSLLFIETRSIKGTSNENLDYYITNFKSPIGESHNRTLLNINYLKKLLTDNNFKLLLCLDENNLAIYKEENPYVIRIIAQFI
jgi:tellurite methyltransferase